MFRDVFGGVFRRVDITSMHSLTKNICPSVAVSAREGPEFTSAGLSV